MIKYIIILFISFSICRAQNYRTNEVKELDNITYINGYSNSDTFQVDTSLVIGAFQPYHESPENRLTLEIRPEDYLQNKNNPDTTLVDLLISFRGLAIVVSGYIIRVREYDYFGGGREYFVDKGFLDENKKPLNKDVQVWQYKLKL